MRDNRIDAAYYRLSKADGDVTEIGDGGKTESFSIASQRMCVQEYAKNNLDVSDLTEFTDDGYTGTNFNRPGFQKLMHEVILGNVRTVIVKDDCVNIELKSEGLENAGLCDVSSVF